ncbi:MAG: hypothetical protein VR66_20100 [Peptococcaceae bacterium BRH_c23]|nr:MAG: hypothetical protein VR66_20100 [Peptococcaceae bacterium BRH_c23]KJS90223.1 MAG: hypothetical protein JL57_03355 [Desulfosporosinus sp. BICA1-9]
MQDIYKISFLFNSNDVLGQECIRSLNLGCKSKNECQGNEDSQKSVEHERPPPAYIQIEHKLKVPWKMFSYLDFVAVK